MSTYEISADRLLVKNGADTAALQVEGLAGVGDRYIGADSTGLVKAMPTPGGGGADLPLFDARDYGYLPDGVRLYDIAMTGGSQILTSALATFTIDDIGKVFKIDGIGVGGISARGTITDFIDANTIEISLGANSTVSGQQMYYGTDNTTAIQDTLNAAFDGGGGTCLFPDGIAMIHGPLITSLSGKNPNSQLYIKFRDPQAAPGNRETPLAIKITGVTPIGFADGALADQNPNMGGTIWYSTLIAVSGTYPSVLSSVGFATGFGDFNAVDMYFENLTVRRSANTTSTGANLCGINGSVFFGTGFNYVRADVDVSGKNTVAPTANTFGLKTAATNSATNISLNNVYGVGNDYAFVFGEHCTGTNIQGCANRVGLGPTQMNHAAWFGRVCLQWNGVVIENFAPEAGVNQFYIQQLDMELRIGGDWYDTTYVVNDPSNMMRGWAKCMPVLQGGALFNKNGGNTFYIIDMMNEGFLSKNQSQGRLSATPFDLGLSSLVDKIEYQMYDGGFSTGTNHIPVRSNLVYQTSNGGYMGIDMWGNPNSPNGNKRIIEFEYHHEAGGLTKGQIDWYIHNGTILNLFAEFLSNQARFLAPIKLMNVTTTEKNALASPEPGWKVFDTTLGKECVYTGSAWETVTSV